jgi:hypothetical protein
VGKHCETPWKFDLNNNNERKDCKIGTMCGGALVMGAGRMKETKVRIYDG